MTYFVTYFVMTYFVYLIEKGIRYIVIQVSDALKFMLCWVAVVKNTEDKLFKLKIELKVNIVC